MGKAISMTKESVENIQALKALQNLVAKHKKYKWKLGQEFCLGVISNEDDDFYTLIKETLTISEYGLCLSRKTQGPRTITKNCPKPFTNIDGNIDQRPMMWHVKEYGLTKERIEKIIEQMT